MDERLLRGVGVLADALAATPSGAGKLRILVVEDNKDAVNALRMLLGWLGHDVRVAYTGIEGLDQAHEWVPDVVLCDIGLPGLDGWAVARELRKDPATAQTRLVAVTAYGTDQDRRRSEDAGFDWHLVKPVDLAELLPLLHPGKRQTSLPSGGALS